MNLRDIKCIKILGGNLGSCSRAFLVEKNGLTFFLTALGENVWSHNSFIQMARVAQGKIDQRIVTSNFVKGMFMWIKIAKKQQKKKLILEGLTNLGEQSNNYLSIY